MLTWPDGFRVAQFGASVALQSDYAPTGTMYLVLQAVKDGQLMALSPVITIRAGSKFPVAGEPCGIISGEAVGCDNPNFPQLCSSGTCRRLCGPDLSNPPLADWTLQSDHPPRKWCWRPIDVSQAEVARILLIDDRTVSTVVTTSRRQAR